MAKRYMSEEDQIAKWSELRAIQEAFPYTEGGLLEFSNYVVHTLIRGKPTLNRVQADILRWLFGGTKYRAIMAQRG